MGEGLHLSLYAKKLGIALEGWMESDREDGAGGLPEKGGGCHG